MKNKENQKRELPKSSLKIIIYKDKSNLNEKWCQMDKSDLSGEYPNVLHLSIADMVKYLDSNPEVSQLEYHFVPEWEKIMKGE